MYIIIAGAGVSGASLARKLSEKKHDVVVIDAKKEACDKLYAETGVVTIHGKATEIEPLIEANVLHADIAIGAMYRDEDNLLFALLCKSYHVPKVIVKMRNPIYKTAFEKIGVDTICDMTGMLTTRVMTELENKMMKVITPLKDGKMQLVTFEVPREWPDDGIKVRDLAGRKEFEGNFIFAGIFDKNSERFYIPRGDDVLKSGDNVFMVAEVNVIKKMSDYLLAMVEEG